MSGDWLTITTIIAMAAATYLTRIGGLYLMKGLAVKGRLKAALDALPPAVLMAVIAPVLGYDHALSIRDQHDASTDPAERARLEGDYSSAKTTAYATLAIPITLAAATGGLAAWWFFGSKEREKREGPRVTVLPGGLVGRF